MTAIVAVNIKHTQCHSHINKKFYIKFYLISNYPIHHDWFSKKKKNTVWRENTNLRTWCKYGRKFGIIVRETKNNYGSCNKSSFEKNGQHARSHWQCMNSYENFKKESKGKSKKCCDKNEKFLWWAQEVGWHCWIREFEDVSIETS